MRIPQSSQRTARTISMACRRHHKMRYTLLRYPAQKDQAQKFQAQNIQTQKPQRKAGVKLRTYSSQIN